MAEKKAEKKDDHAERGVVGPDERFKYVGFEVQAGKIKDLFKSEAEQDEWKKKVVEKRQSRGSRLRDESTFDIPRVAGYEKIVLTITSLVLLVSLFLPWFSGYHEYEVKAEVATPAPVAGLADSLSDSLSVMPDVTTPADTAMMTAVADSAAVDSLGQAASQIVEDDRDARGFASITGARERKEWKKEHQSISAIAAVASFGSFGGKVFSSGAVLVITVILLLVYLLLCIFSPVYTLIVLYGGGKDPDRLALKLKKALRLNWIPVIIWVVCLLISFLGASYSFDTSDMLKQIGSGYGIATFLGLLGYGFYISLACFIISAAKAVEI